jgi:para-aminobenzoate synthetase component 1
VGTGTIEVEPQVQELKLGGVSFYDLAQHFSGRKDFALLDSRGPEPDRYSWFAFAPFAVVASKGKTVRIRPEAQGASATDDVFGVLQRLLRGYAIPRGRGPAGAPFLGGAMGYFAYELGRQVERLPQRAVDQVNVPDCSFGFYNWAVLLSQADGRMFLSYFDPRPLAAPMTRADLLAEFERVRPGSYAAEEGAPSRGGDVAVEADLSRQSYVDAVRRIKGYIWAGDVYQVNMTQRFRVRGGDAPWPLYKRLLRINPAPFGAFLNLDGLTVVSSSPERFLRVDGRAVETRPVKGTVARGVTPEDDARARDWLLDSPKNRAELAMIVDLCRNDLGRVCAPGSVKVAAYPVLESYASVHHLVATVTGALRPESGVMDLVRACFPGGSITGAPKIRAMEIIDELEPVTRGVYTGSIGYLGFDGRADLNIAIRTIIVKDGLAYVHAGGGVVADSDEAEEYEESLHKARALFTALGG